MASSIPIKVVFPQSSHHDVHIAGFVAEYARDLGIDGNEWDVITELSRYQWGKLEVNPTLRTIAMRLRCIKTQNEISRIKLTSRYLSSLQTKGLITIICNQDGKGRTIGNTYDLTPLFQKAYKMAIDCGYFDTLKMGYEALHTPTTEYPLPPLHSTPTPTVQYPSIERVTVEEKQEKDKNLLPTATADGYDAGNTELATVQHETPQVRASAPNVNSAEKKPTPVKRDEKYKALEAVVKTIVFAGADSIGMQGGAIIQFLVISQASPSDLQKFARWYATQNTGAALPRQCKRVKGTDDFEGKFVTHWQAWRKATTPKTAPRPTPQPEQELTAAARAEMLALITKGN